MKITKRIIIRIIVAVAVAVILSKLKLIGIMNVSALSANTTFTYENVLISQKQVEFNFTTPFATNMKRGTLKTNVVITNNIVPASQNKTTVLRQAIVYNGTSTNVCSIGSVNSGSIFAESNNNNTNTFDSKSTTYTLECEVTPNPKIEKIVLYFSGTMNYAYLSFGPNVSFRENDILLEMQKQNETCFPTKNLLNNTLSSQTTGGITITKNSDGTLILNGTANNLLLFNLGQINLTSGTYTLSGVTNASSSSARLDVRPTSAGITVFDTWQLPEKPTITINTNENLYVFLRLASGSSYNNVVIRPQVEKGSSATSYEKFTEECKSKQDILLDEQKEQTKQQKETNDLIKSDDTTESNAKGKDFFDNFTSDSHGLSGVITSPLRLLNSFTTSSCSPLEFDLPFNMGHVSLPCMRGIYEQHFGIFFSLWQLITTGLISYNVCLNFYSKIRAMQNPYNDRIEVLNL